MTQYLTGKPFSVPTCPSGEMSTEEYFVRVGALVWCPACDKNVSAPHAKCPKAK